MDKRRIGLLRALLALLASVLLAGPMAEARSAFPESLVLRAGGPERLAPAGPVRAAALPALPAGIEDPEDDPERDGVGPAGTRFRPPAGRAPSLTVGRAAAGPSGLRAHLSTGPPAR